ncbi:MAG TPA: Rossmann-like and DUF2520 domain-containing protein [Egibacteraceae bacterium]|nr:Rossmann-like and DUF2520 domain-containing protein [Egibacteraceae bacterium]
MRRTAVIGPGRVGTALGIGLARAGYDVATVAGRGQQALDRFRRRVPGAVALPAAEAAAGAELVVVCVPDDALAEVVLAIVRDDGVAEGSRWVHVAGGHGLDVLRPASLAGARTAACHPAQTFPDPDTGAEELPGTTWAVTAADDDIGWARVLVTDLRGSPVSVAAGSRTLYHTGLVVGANATSAVVALARDLLLGAGVAEPAAFLGPLVTTAAGHAAERGADALTGPVRRGDAGTVGRQLDELRTAVPEAVDAYLELARLALRYARRAGLDPAAAEAVAAVLDHGAGGGR